VKLNIKELDKYFTKEHVAIQCINSVDLQDYDLIIEPSAGVSPRMIAYLTPRGYE